MGHYPSIYFICKNIQLLSTCVLRKGCKNHFIQRKYTFVFSEVMIKGVFKTDMNLKRKYKKCLFLFQQSTQNKSKHSILFCITFYIKILQFPNNFLKNASITCQNPNCIRIFVTKCKNAVKPRCVKSRRNYIVKI